MGKILPVQSTKIVFLVQNSCQGIIEMKENDDMILPDQLGCQ
jgi:hypothetical protein